MYFAGLFTGQVTARTPLAGRPGQGEPTGPVRFKTLLTRPDPTHEVSNTS